MPLLQVLTWVLSYDGEQAPEPLAITAASAALCISGGQFHSQPSSAVNSEVMPTKQNNKNLSPTSSLVASSSRDDVA